MPGSSLKCRECRRSFRGNQKVTALCVICKCRSHISCLRASLASEGREFDPLVASDPLRFSCSACAFESTLPGFLIEQTDTRRASLISALATYVDDDKDEEVLTSTGVASTPKSQSDSNIYGLSPEARGSDFVVRDFSNMINSTDNDLRNSVIGMSEDISKLMGIINLITYLNNSVERLHLENVAIKAQLSEVLKAQSSVDKHVCRLGVSLSSASKSTTPQMTVTLSASGQGRGSQGTTRTTERPPGGEPAPIHLSTTGLYPGTSGTSASSTSAQNQSGVSDTALNYNGMVQSHSVLPSGEIPGNTSPVTQRIVEMDSQSKKSPLRTTPKQRVTGETANLWASPIPNVVSQEGCGDADGFTEVIRKRRKKSKLGNDESSRGRNRGARQPSCGVRIIPSLPTVGTMVSTSALFATRFDPLVTVKDIEGSLNSLLGLAHIKCTKLKTRFNTYASFHIEVPEADFVKINNPDIWPKGCLFYKFHGRLRSNQILKVDDIH